MNKKADKKKYGDFGGAFVPELLISPLEDLEKSWISLKDDLEFQKRLKIELKTYCGRPTPLTRVDSFATAYSKARLYLKREDLLHTGAHKINNAIGQCLLAKKMGKRRVIAETGAGQHGVATATAAARLKLDCIVYMGEKDCQRQQPNVKRMLLLGAKVVSVDSGSQTLKDAVNEAMRDWAQNYEDSHYCLGSALGPYPYPQMVRGFHEVIGLETKEQFFKEEGALPSHIIACVGGGSNSIGIFSAFLEDGSVKLIGVEAGGEGIETGKHAARMSKGKPGVLHGTYSYLLQDEYGQVLPTHSISAGLDYPSIGPEHAYLYEKNRVHYTHANDEKTIEALQALSRSEGIIPALESSHALAYFMEIGPSLTEDHRVVINLSGRGDKDLPSLFEKEVLKL